jgi:hypothetical protein
MNVFLSYTHINRYIYDVFFNAIIVFELLLFSLLSILNFKIIRPLKYISLLLLLL